jgi:hypothetical protein
MKRELQLFIDNGRPHAAHALPETVWELKWELLDHLLYSPNLAEQFSLFWSAERTLRLQMSFPAMQTFNLRHHCGYNSSQHNFTQLVFRHLKNDEISVLM